MTKVKRAENLIKVGLSWIMQMDEKDDTLLAEQSAKLRERLMGLNDHLHAAKKMVSFKIKEAGWTEGLVRQKIEELDEGCKKGDILLKKAKNLLASIKQS